MSVQPCLPCRLHSTRSGRRDGSGSMTPCSRSVRGARSSSADRRRHWRDLHDLSACRHSPTIKLTFQFHSRSPCSVPQPSPCASISHAPSCQLVEDTELEDTPHLVAASSSTTHKRQIMKNSELGSGSRGNAPFFSLCRSKCYACSLISVVVLMVMLVIWVV